MVLKPILTLKLRLSKSPELRCNCWGRVEEYSKLKLNFYQSAEIGHRPEAINLKLRPKTFQTYRCTNSLLSEHLCAMQFTIKYQISFHY